VTCTPNAKRTDSIPTLAQMTEKAIDLLSKNEKGFFLQVKAHRSINKIMLPIRAARLVKL
jgi:hypothetical protein